MEIRPETSIWMLDEATYVLAPGVTLDGRHLRDEHGATFPLNESGMLICRLGVEPADVAESIRGVALLYEVEPESVAGEVRGFIAELSRRGLVSIHQSFAREIYVSLRHFTNMLSAALIDKSIMRYGGRFPLRRYPPRARSVLRACVEAYQPLLWTGAILTPLFLVAGADIETLNMYMPTTVPQLGLALILYFLCISLTGMAHEFGHWYASRWLGLRCISVNARRGTASLSFLPCAPKRAILVTLAGPLSGLVVLVLIGLSYWSLGPDRRIQLGIEQLTLSGLVALLTIGAMQLLSLTPVTLDGRHLLASIRLLVSGGTDA